jgi:hypothetical protein
LVADGTAMSRLAHFSCAAAGLALAAPATAAPPAAVWAGGQARAPANAPRATPQLSAETSRVLRWIAASGDNLELPFVIVDKVHARVMAFDRYGAPQGSAPALMGLGRGDVSPAGIGQRRLADITPAERITPAGRFIASLGNDLGEADILWVDYDNAISLHRVISGNRKDRRLERLASASVDDNRISYGCINVPPKFFEGVILPLFNRTNGIVYILPEARPLSDVFHLPAEPRTAAAS